MRQQEINMITDRQQLINIVREKYQGVEDLSKTGTDFTTACVYDQSVNGVGCFIGALYPKEESAILESYSVRANKRGGTSITGLLDIPEAVRVLKTEIDVDTVGRDFLLQVQRAHDSSKSVPEAMERLRIVENDLRDGEYN